MKTPTLPQKTEPATISPTSIVLPLEQAVTFIKLQGPAAEPDAEFSGLAWYGDTLILLPQYPKKFGADDGAFFALSKIDILAYLNGTHPTPLEPALIHLNAPGLKKSISDFQGYEAITFYGDQVYLTIEAGNGDSMHGYIVTGTISKDGKEITLNKESLVEIPLPIKSEGRSNEALLIMDKTVLAIFEDNSSASNPTPTVHAFDLNLNPLPAISFPNLEYRVTDAAFAGEDSFWVLNTAQEHTTLDSLAEKYEQGPTHSTQEQVERLVKMRFSQNAITLADSPPIMLQLDGGTLRKWEGLVLLGTEGFLMVTDKSPLTLLAFVPMP